MKLDKTGMENLMKAEIDKDLNYPKRAPSGQNKDNNHNTFCRKTSKINLEAYELS